MLQTPLSLQITTSLLLSTGLNSLAASVMLPLENCSLLKQKREGVCRYSVITQSGSLSHVHAK
jgi:hypothetical protein